ncbi:hypothetical protein T492DRAFT_1083315, partial [Pavlovales sp. CCMP2436]
GGYWAQHCFPDENIDFCLGVDNAILKQASVALGCDPTTDWLAHKRLYLQTRLAGLGLSSLSETRSAAFVASAAPAATSFLDQHDATGIVTVHGVLERPSIAERIGRDPFSAPGSQGWRKFGDSGSRLGAAIIATGTALRARAPPGYTGELRMLRAPPEEMGLRGKGLHGTGLQTAIKSDLQQIEHETLSEQLAHRPRGDRQMQLFRNISRESMINRSGKLDAERRRQLQQTDREIFRTREGQVGPMEQRLNGFPPVIGIATGGFGEQSKSLDNLLKNFAGMGAETWMDKLSTPTTMQARNTLLGLMRKELGVIVARGHARLILARARSLHTQTARAAAGARGAPWFQRTGRSANGTEDAPAHGDGAYRDDNWRSHNADRGARLGRGGRGGQGTRT